jgi:hypothetical protein
LTPRNDPFKYFRRLHTGATAWNVFAQLGVNPYYEPLGAPTQVEAHFNGTAAAIAWTAVPGAASYEISRSGDGLTFVPIGTPTSANTTDPGVAAGSAYLYRVRAQRAGATPSAWSASELMTAVLFSDDPIVAFSTVVQAQHVTQLRSAVNAVRTLASLAPVSFTDSSLSATPIRAIHLQELRDGLAPARTALALASLSFAHPTLQPGVSMVSGVDVGELRVGVR